jgi:hypothetical protein
MSVSDNVYEAAVQGRRDFRNALRTERQKTKRLLAVIANFANEKNWSDEPANLRWDGKRHAVEYAQSVIAEET